MNRAKEIKVIPLDSIIPNEKNRNKHSPEQIERLRSIIEYQGFRIPVIISNRSGKLVAGHGRVLAARELGLKEIPAIYQDFDSDEQEYAAGISDNSVSAWAELDLSAINTDIADLGPDFDIDLLGIKDFVIEPADKFHADEDDVPPTPVESKVRLGDLWALGGHRLLCGDCTVKENVERLMGGEKADMVFTDPPYGYGHLGDFQTKTLPGRTGRSADFARPLTGDSGEWDYDPSFILNYFNECKDIFLWGADYYCWKLPKDGSWVVWNKIGENDDLNNLPGAAFELCWSRHKHQRQLINLVWRGVLGHIKNLDGERKCHPTQKPTRLAQWFFERWGKDAKIIWDGYLGSGSTLIACEKTGRKCYGSEIDPLYCQVIIDRYEKFTGKKAEKIG